MTETITEFDIEELREAGSDGGSFMGWFARGHVDPFEFHSRVAYDYDLDTDDRRWFRPEDVVHTYYRTVQVPDDVPGEMQYIPSKPGRGAWAVTVIDIEARNFERRERIRTEARDAGERSGVNWCLRWMEEHGLAEYREEMLADWRVRTGQDRKGRCDD